MRHSVDDKKEELWNIQPVSYTMDFVIIKTDSNVQRSHRFGELDWEVWKHIPIGACSGSINNNLME